MTLDTPAATELHAPGQRRTRRAGLVAAIALALTACGGAGAGPGDAGGALAFDLRGSLSAEDAAVAADGVNAFGFDLHTAVAQHGDNTVTSPLSAAVLLGMVTAGTGGDTAEEMVDLLRLDGPKDTRYAALLADLIDTDDDVTLAIANSLWATEGYPFEEDYDAFVQDTYGATLDEVDLGSQDAADAIDNWVDERTNGLIEEIAEDLGLPNPQAVLVLLNTVYFSGTWTTTFDEDDTRQTPFTLAGGNEVDVPTMHRQTAELQTAVGDGFQMLRLPYGEEERFGMEVLLPDHDVALDELLDNLDADVWRNAVDRLEPATFSEIALPRFKVEWDANLNEVLQSLGMVSAFAGGDFTPMSPANPFLDTVVQKTYIQVDENGTEAAAVTGGAMADSAGPPPFRVDRPFAFTVSDRETGAILFLGTVHDPRG